MIATLAYLRACFEQYSLNRRYVLTITSQTFAKKDLPKEHRIIESGGFGTCSLYRIIKSHLKWHANHATRNYGPQA